MMRMVSETDSIQLREFVKAWGGWLTARQQETVISFYSIDFHVPHLFLLCCLRSTEFLSYLKHLSHMYSAMQNQAPNISK